MDAAQAYRILSVEPETSLLDIRRKYRQLAKKYHPDKCSDPTIFASISQAFQFLEKQPPGTAAPAAAGSSVIISQDKPRILEFVDEQGQQVRQEVTVRHTSHGHQQVMAVTMPGTPSPPSSPEKNEQEPVAVQAVDRLGASCAAGVAPACVKLGAPPPLPTFVTERCPYPYPLVELAEVGASLSD